MPHWPLAALRNELSQAPQEMGGGVQPVAVATEAVCGWEGPAWAGTAPSTPAAVTTVARTASFFIVASCACRRNARLRQVQPEPALRRNTPSDVCRAATTGGTADARRGQSATARAGVGRGVSRTRSPGEYPATASLSTWATTTCP